MIFKVFSNQQVGGITSQMHAGYRAVRVPGENRGQLWGAGTYYKKLFVDM